MPYLVYILTGSNLGNPISHLQRALYELESTCGAIVQCSSLYKTAAWGNTSQAAFLNQVIAIETNLTALQLLAKVLEIESQMGRVRIEKWEPRMIDIDLLFFGDQIINEPNLILPHPFIPERRFTLIPMVEIAPNLVHPKLGKTMVELLAACKDELLVEKLG